MSGFLKGPTEKFFDLSPLLQEVYLAISIAARPVHAKEIVSILEKKNGSDFWKGGKTPEKTVNARISEHILKSKNQLFFRTGPNLFYHKPLNEAARFDSQYEESWHLPRVKPLTDEFVLVADKKQLEQIMFGRFIALENVQMDKLKDDLCYFMSRSEAESNKSVKQFVSYSMVRTDDQFLVYRRGKWSNPSANLYKKWSLAFGGHVSQEDLTLFDDFEDCFVNNSSREVKEELKLVGAYKDDVVFKRKPSLKGFINVDDNSDAMQHIAAVVEISLHDENMPSTSEDEITQLQWVNRAELVALRGEFDLWSRYLIDRIGEGV